MKKLIYLSLAFISFQFVNAQDKEKINSNKKFYLNTGIQFESLDYLKRNKNFYIGGEYKLNDTESIALNLNYFDMGYENAGGSSLLGNPKSFGFQFQFNHDWSKLIGLNNDKFDLYTGVGLGLAFTKVNNYIYPNGITSKEFSETELNMGGQIGLRYFVTKNIGVSTELNFNLDNTHLKTGLTYKF
jgi:hypothetical protein